MNREHPSTNPWLNQTDNGSANTSAWPPERDPLIEALHLHWPRLKAELKERYLALTDDDLIFAEGGEDDFLDHLERKTGFPRDEFEQIILVQTGHLVG